MTCCIFWMFWLQFCSEFLEDNEGIRVYGFEEMTGWQKCSCICCTFYYWIFWFQMFAINVKVSNDFQNFHRKMFIMRFFHLLCHYGFRKGCPRNWTWSFMTGCSCIWRSDHLQCFKNFFSAIFSNQVFQIV